MNSSFKKLHGVVVGLGSIGNRHLNNLIELGVGRLTVIRRPNSQNAQFTPPENVATSYSLSETLESNPDFAIICNPSHLHAASAIQFLEADVHVLIEKPLGQFVGENEKRLIEVSKDSNIVCAMAYSMRYHPAYRLAYEQVRSGAIGKCLYAKAWFEGYLPAWHPWEDYKQSYAAQREQGGGVLRTLDHELDFMNWVLGPAKSATGLAANTEGIAIDADDLAMYVLEHPDNVTSQITVSFCRQPQSRGFEFVGDTGVLSFRFEKGTLIKYTDGKEQTILDVTNYDINQMYVDMAKDFLNSIVDQTSPLLPLLSTGVDSLNAIARVSQNV